MSKLKVLYVSSEISPFLDLTEVSKYVRKLPEVMQEKGMEIRILVPRFGLINERKNRLHEVVRLSGINISVGDEEKSLIIKVASIPTARLQVYFIDNDDYFHRKYALHDKDNKFYHDNDERAIFFSKGVLETVKKLGWSPDIIHCNDWMTSLIPMYLKTHYKKDPIFKNSKSVFTVFNSEFSHAFDPKSLINKAKMHDITESVFDPMLSGNYHSFVHMGIQYADYALLGEPELTDATEKYIANASSISLPEFQHTGDDNMEFFYNLYQELAGVNELIEG